MSVKVTVLGSSCCFRNRFLPASPTTTEYEIGPQDEQRARYQRGTLRGDFMSVLLRAQMRLALLIRMLQNHVTYVWWNFAAKDKIVRLDLQV
jgi:hypothetical protein